MIPLYCDRFKLSALSVYPQVEQTKKKKEVPEDQDWGPVHFFFFKKGGGVAIKFIYNILTLMNQCLL